MRNVTTGTRLGATAALKYAKLKISQAVISLSIQTHVMYVEIIKEKDLKHVMTDFEQTEKDVLPTA